MSQTTEQPSKAEPGDSSRSSNCSTASVIARLEEAIRGASGDVDFTSSTEGLVLMAAAGEALGALKVIGGSSMTQLLYDFARLAAAGGWVPDDFEDKSKQ